MIKEHILCFKTTGNKASIYGLEFPYWSAANTYWLSPTLNGSDKKLLNEVVSSTCSHVTSEFVTQARIVSKEILKASCPRDFS